MSKRQPVGSEALNVAPKDQKDENESEIENLIEDTIEEVFPASDPAVTPERDRDEPPPSKDGKVPQKQ